MTEPKGKDRRLKPRFSAALRCTLSLPPEDRDILFPHEQLDCLTRDLSESGIGLVAPSIYLGYTCVVDEGRTLRLRLDTGTAIIELEATSAHYLRLDEPDDTAATYLIGLRLTEPPGDNLTRYLDYLKQLSAAEEA
jgi:hypothetical protein